ncbi:MAG: adenylyl-sulfate kinase [Accumulibacter sp.]|uniref:adenylyl-sulfate kinase n=1 Tax=Accumulibacter sp. TaxID=2053492 RepID=UPI002FC2FEC9
MITAFISAWRADRAAAPAIIGAARFREVHVATSLAVCEARDPKGMYARAPPRTRRTHRHRLFPVRTVSDGWHDNNAIDGLLPETDGLWPADSCRRVGTHRG